MRKLLVLSLILATVPVAAQYRDEGPPPSPLYRDGQPEVMRAAPPPPPPGAIAAGSFRAAYNRAKRPRMLVFWNRSFSDEVSSNYRDNLHVETASDSNASVRYGFNGADASSSNRSSLDASTGTQRVEQGRLNPLDENVDFAVEAAFSETLASNGAQLIDRSLAMRTARGARGAGSRPNMQAIETEAATGRADLLVEILQTPAPGTPTGVSFKVTVKDIRRARLLTAFTSSGREPYVKPKLVAGPGASSAPSRAALRRAG